MQDYSSTPRLTVLVFKENLVARSFQIPLSWITRFGVVVSCLVVLATGATILAVKYYRIAERSDFSRVEDLEREIDTLRSAYTALETKSAGIPVAPTALAPAQSASAESSTTATTLPALTDTSAEPNGTPGPTRNLIVLPLAGGSRLLFAALPSEIQAPPEDPNALSIRIQQPKLQWVGKKLRIGFAIQYVRTDGGSQQGRIVILARGSESVVAYPEGVVNAAGAPALLAPDKGEYFSVGRYREVRADLPAVDSGLKHVEVLLLSQSGQMLIYDRFEVPSSRSAAPAPKPPVKTAPKASTTPEAETLSPDSTTAPAPSTEAPAKATSPGTP
jgi:hypothetical protein